MTSEPGLTHLSVLAAFPAFLALVGVFAIWLALFSFAGTFRPVLALSFSFLAPLLALGIAQLFL